MRVLILDTQDSKADFEKIFREALILKKDTFPIRPRGELIMIHEKQNAILSFWFGDDPLKPLKNEPLWFQHSEVFDQQIRDSFESILIDASRNAFEDWTRTPNGALALVILLDQFPRHIYRGNSDAFAFDNHALKEAQIAVSRNFDRKMTIVERCFLYLPFEHSEDILVQEQSLKLFKNLFDEATGAEKRFIASALQYAVRHHDIIALFGRFPHRNEILGRKNSSAEQEFLKRPNARF
jgi:uncharacterized protein (DUF924 family)